MRDEFKVRAARLSDLPNIYHICVQTAADGTDASGLCRDDFLVGQFFAAPYVHFELSNCFVVDYRGNAVGYILGPTDTKKFNQWMNTAWLPGLRQAYPQPNPQEINETATISGLETYTLGQIHNGIDSLDLLEQYPSHLHIDILPIAQGKGFGRALIETYVQCLIKKHSKGLHISVSKRNENAIAFYKKLGFSLLSENEGAVFLGMKL